MADWYYIGHYGQLGPLEKEQIDDLILGGVISGETFVWKTGMPNWLPASDVADLRPQFATSAYSSPPPPPGPAMSSPMPPPPTEQKYATPYGSDAFSASAFQGTFAPATYNPYLPTLKSDRSRIAGGLLNMFVPGVGRMYLGYWAQGVIQLVVTIVTCGVLWIWPFIDGILMLAGSVKLDGYGRRLED